MAARIPQCIVVFGGGGFFCFVISVAVRRAAAEVRLIRRNWAQRQGSAVRKDGRRPVLLLRAFSDDAIPLHRHLNRFPITDLKGRLVFNAALTFEEMISRMFKRLGPVVAIGRPGETLPPLGAARFWIRHDRWQEVVDHLLEASQLIVMVMGDIRGEDGLAWEVRRIFASEDPAKIVLFMPPVAEEQARHRWQKYAQLSGGKIPSYRGGELAATFSKDWSCRVARDVPPPGFLRGSILRYRLLIQVERPRRQRESAEARPSDRSDS